MIEQWRDIPGWDGAYQASTLGRIRSVTKTISTLSRWGTPHVYQREGRVLKLSVDKDGYLTCHLRHAGRSKKGGVHRFVCEAFHGEAPSPQHEAAHGDGVRTNNVPDNIRWATTKENFDDRYRHGTAPVGSAHGKAMINERDVLTIRARRRRGEAYASIAKDFPLKEGAILKVALGHTWGHI